MDNNSLQSPPQTEKPGRRLFLILLLLLSLLGVGVSIELTRIHHSTHTDPLYESICAVSDAVNCETVARSPFSVFLGAPVSVWGIFCYTLLAFFIGWGLKGSSFHNRYPFGILFVMIVAALIAAGLLAHISFTRIDSICLFCMTLYCVNTLLFVVLTTHLIRARINPFTAFWADIRALLKRPVILAAVAVPAIAAFLVIMLAIPPYWQHVGWRELPKLKTGTDPNGLHWIGAASPLVTIIEFSDYQCPFCRKAHKDIRMLAADFPNEVRLIHRHLPLDNSCNDEIDRPFHDRACEFAKAAECAAEQKMFWDMNDALFSVQDTMKAADVDLEMLAVELGLDRSSFNECMAQPGISKRMRIDMKDAKKLEIRGTPTFFIGVQPYEGHIPPVVVKNAVERARKKRANKQ